MEAAKYCNQAQVDMFSTMIHRSLSIYVGRPVYLLSRHVNALGCRILLLKMALSLLQSMCVRVINNLAAYVNCARLVRYKLF